MLDRINSNLDWISSNIEAIAIGVIAAAIFGVISWLAKRIFVKIAKMPIKTAFYLYATFERKRLGVPYPWWECIGGRMGNLATGKIAYEDADDIPDWLDEVVLKRVDTMIAIGLLPVFDFKCQDDDYIYWVVSQAPYGRPPTLAFYRRPRLIRWSNQR